MGTDSPERQSGRTFALWDGAYSVTVELGTVGGRWQAIGVDVRSYGAQGSERGALTTRQLRAIRVGDAIKEASDALRAELREEMKKGKFGKTFTDAQGRHRVSIPGVAAVRGLEQIDRPLPRPGRPRLEATELAKLREAAEIYREADIPGGSPTLAVAKWLAAYGTRPPRSTASKWVKRCRELGLLEPYKRQSAPRPSRGPLSESP